MIGSPQPLSRDSRRNGSHSIITTASHSISLLQVSCEHCVWAELLACCFLSPWYPAWPLDPSHGTPRDPAAHLLIVGALANRLSPSRWRVSMLMSMSICLGLTGTTTVLISPGAFSKITKSCARLVSKSYLPISRHRLHILSNDRVCRPYVLTVTILQAEESTPRCSRASTS